MLRVVTLTPLLITLKSMDPPPHFSVLFYVWIVSISVF